MPSKADLDEALEAADKGFDDLEARSRPSSARRSCARPPTCCASASSSIATLMTHGAGQAAGRGEGARSSPAPTSSTGSPRKARRTYGRVIPARAEGVYQLVIKEPVGPVAAFTPWNFPINQVVRKLSAALAAGCSIIVKAPEETPASPAELIRAFVDAGVPAGVVNLVYGDPGRDLEYLIPHPVIRKISFTGSTVVGKQLAALAGQHMKRVDDGARRPRAGDRVRRRRRRRRREGDGGEQVPQRRPGLRLADPLPGAGRRLRRASSTASSPTPSGSRSATAWRAASHMGAAGQPAPHRARWTSTSRTRAKHGAQGPDRRRAHRRQGQLLRADRRHRAAPTTPGR